MEANLDNLKRLLFSEWHRSQHSDPRVVIHTRPLFGRKPGLATPSEPSDEISLTA